MRKASHGEVSYGSGGVVLPAKNNSTADFGRAMCCGWARKACEDGTELGVRAIGDRRRGEGEFRQ